MDVASKQQKTLKNVRVFSVQDKSGLDAVLNELK